MKDVWLPDTPHKIDIMSVKLCTGGTAYGLMWPGINNQPHHRIAVSVLSPYNNIPQITPADVDKVYAKAGSHEIMHVLARCDDCQHLTAHDNQQNRPCLMKGPFTPGEARNGHSEAHTDHIYAVREQVDDF